MWLWILIDQKSLLLPLLNSAFPIKIFLVWWGVKNYPP